MRKIRVVRRTDGDICITRGDFLGDLIMNLTPDEALELQERLMEARGERLVDAGLAEARRILRGQLRRVLEGKTWVGLVHAKNVMKDLLGLLDESKDVVVMTTTRRSILERQVEVNRAFSKAVDEPLDPLDWLPPSWTSEYRAAAMARAHADALKEAEDREWAEWRDETAAAWTKMNRDDTAYMQKRYIPKDALMEDAHREAIHEDVWRTYDRILNSNLEKLARRQMTGEGYDPKVCPKIPWTKKTRPKTATEALILAQKRTLSRSEMNELLKYKGDYHTRNDIANLRDDTRRNEARISDLETKITKLEEQAEDRYDEPNPPGGY